MAGGLLGVVLAFVVGRRLLGPAVGLTWAGLMATYWGFIYFEGMLTGTWLVIDLLLAIVWALQTSLVGPP